MLGKVERWELVGGVDSVVARLEGGGVAGRAQILWRLSCSRQEQQQVRL